MKDETKLTLALELLRNAESILGTVHTETLPFADDGRRRWLKDTRKLLTDCGVPPENLSGFWHTEEGEPDEKGSAAAAVRRSRRRS